MSARRQAHRTGREYDAYKEVTVTKKFVFKTAGGKEFTFSIPEPANVNSFFVFSIYKAGSTLLMMIMADVCKALRIPVIDFPAHLFGLGLAPKDLTDGINRLWRERGFAYTGFRSFFPSMEFDFSKTKNILLVRDPRDMLVSLYFSVKYSHPIPKLEQGEHPMTRERAALQKIGIDQSVIDKTYICRKYFQDYMEHLPAATTRVYRYEDIVFKKKEWIEDMLDFLRLKLRNQEIEAIAAKYDIRPEKEDPRKHIRQVIPGNYKFHLSRATIDKLNEVFRPVLHYFHYDSVMSMKMNSQAQRAESQRISGGPGGINDHIRRLESDLEAMNQSWSWRITAPLRRFASYFTKV